MSRQRKRKPKQTEPTGSLTDDLLGKLADQESFEEASGSLYIESIPADEWATEVTPEEIQLVANKTFFTVVIYDIANDARRVKLAKVLLGYAERVQYSGFEAYLTLKQLETLKAKIRDMIDHEEDRVRIYRIAGVPTITVYGIVPKIIKEEFTII